MFEKMHFHSRLSRSYKASGSGSRFSLVGPTRVKACKSFLFTEKLTSNVEPKVPFYHHELPRPKFLR